MDRGYIGLFRKFFEHNFWTKKRKYSEAEAWIDLLQMARWKDEPVTLMDDRGQYVLDIGDIHASLRFLGTRWKWSTKKVSHFLSILIQDGSIKFKIRNSVRSIIHITKLKTYMNWIKGERNTEETLRKHSGNTEETKKKKGNKEKKENVDLKFEEIWKRYPNKDGKKDALKHFRATVKGNGDWDKINMALDNYLAHLKVKTWKEPKNGSTWFNNWEDWVEVKVEKPKRYY